MTGLRLRTEVFSTHSAYYGGWPCFAVVVLSPSSHTLLRYSFTYPTNKQTNKQTPCPVCPAPLSSLSQSSIHEEGRRWRKLNVTAVRKVPVRRSVPGKDNWFFFFSPSGGKAAWALSWPTHCVSGAAVKNKWSPTSAPHVFVLCTRNWLVPGSHCALYAVAYRFVGADISMGPAAFCHAKYGGSTTRSNRVPNCSLSQDRPIAVYLFITVKIQNFVKNRTVVSLLPSSCNISVLSDCTATAEAVPYCRQWNQ